MTKERERGGEKREREWEKGEYVEGDRRGEKMEK